MRDLPLIMVVPMAAVEQRVAVEHLVPVVPRVKAEQKVAVATAAVPRLLLLLPPSSPHRVPVATPGAPIYAHLVYMSTNQRGTAHNSS
jgi:hypothetical protein